MKRFFALAMALLIALSLCACGGGNTTGTGANQSVTEASEVIAKELQGAWYGPLGQPMLSINADGTGTVILDTKSYSAKITAENDIFSVTSEGYSISGNYTLEGEKLTVTADYDGTEFTVIFTREPAKLSQDNIIYNYNDVTYEINFTEGTVTVCQFPPSDTPDIINVYFYVENNIIHVYPQPPTPPHFPIPETIDTGKETPEVTVDGKPTDGYASNDDIVGTWTTVQDGTVSFFGVTNETTVPITYTFNSDGTGTILAMGIIPGTMTYSVENGVFNLTVSMLGDTESGTGYIKRVGDKLYIKNHKDEVQELVKQG